MNKLILILLTFLSLNAHAFKHMDAGVIVGDRQAPETSAAFQVESTTQGMLGPRMTEAERDVITAIEALMIYNTTSGSYETWNGAAWVSLGGGVGMQDPTAVDGQLLIGSTGIGYVSGSLTGTLNQITVVPASGTLTLNLPQDINVGASPTFVSGTFTGLLPSAYVRTDVSSGLSSVVSIPFSDVTGIVPAAQGGSGLDASSAANGTFLIGNGSGFDLNVVSGTANQVIATPSAGGLTLSAPQDIHSGASPTFVSATFSGVLANEYLKTDGASGLTSVSSIPLSDLTGILPQDQGGTGLDASVLANGEIFIGNGSGFVSATVTGTLNQVAVTNGAGSITLSAPQDIHAGASPTFVSATFSGVLPSEFLKTDASSGLTSISSIDLTADISGILPIANGGTNSSTALNDDRILVSSGGSIVEAAALTDGQLLIGSTGAAPVAANLTGTTNQVNIANTSGTVTFSLPQDIHTGASPTFLAASLGNVDVVGNIISSSNANGNITLTPNGTGAVVISSDLQISGDFITVSSSTMDVDNATISVNVNGNQAAADVNDAGLIVVMSDATNSTIHYDSTLTSKFAAGDIGSTSEIVTVSDAQSITNKTLIQVDNLSLNGNTLSSSAGDIILDPTGNINFPDLTASLPLQLDASNNVIAAAIDFTNLTGIVPQDQGGTGLDASALANGEIFIGNGSGFVSATVTGTLNQVAVTNGAGSITLSAPQDIHVGASPTFVSATFSGVLPSEFVKTDASSGLTSASSISLTADVSGVLPIANGGTGSATQNFVDLTTNQTILGDKIVSGTLTTTLPFSAGQFATGDLPAAASFDGYIAYDTTLNSYVFSDGTTWEALSGTSTTVSAVNLVTTEIADGNVAVNAMTINPAAGDHTVSFNTQYSTAATLATAQAKTELAALVVALEALPIAGGARGLAFGTEIINAGVYDLVGAATGTASATLTLDGQSNPNALFVFRITSSLTIGSSFTINLINQANPNNVFFLTTSGISVATGSVLQGNFIAKTTGSATTSTLLGRLLSTAGALTPTALTINKPPLASTTQTLGTIESFALFTSAGAITNAGISVINGDVGTDAGAISGFTAASTVNGSFYTPTSTLSNFTLGVYLDGVLVPGSDRTVTEPDSVSDVIHMYTPVTTTTAGQTIDVRVQAANGSITVGNRILSTKDGAGGGSGSGAFTFDRVQTKTLSANHSTVSTISDLSFSNLVIDKLYQICAVASVRFATNNGGANLIFTHNSVEELKVLVSDDGTVDYTATAGGCATFKAATTTLSASSSTASGGSFLNGNATHRTKATLTELNTTAETTGF